ncbi:hypothetical protein F5148DRAFT_1353273 [Russula earlei]|uniref:Uncharacterized protein n=1 Tax=Russula earlei TaxID=71964 RepID=A0ACC0UBT8_9AGAM|nr:hypothetical protein F5148DRAFT_1353273 [Russula earlei]
MPRDSSISINERSKTYEALPYWISSEQAVIQIRNRPQQDKPLSHVNTPGADSDEDTPDSETSDEWSTDSDTSDTTLSNDLRPCSAVPLTSSPILVPDAFPERDLPNLTIQTDLSMHPPSSLRPMFPNHGLSRSALQHQKWLWNTRYDEWMQWRMEVETAEAEIGLYGGISSTAANDIPPTRCSRASSPMPPETEHPQVGKKAELNEKIFPRTGDIMALHDPQVARLDQTFCNYPLWTIQKVLFACSMDTAARGRHLTRKVDSHGDSQDTDAPPSTMEGVRDEEHALVPNGLPLSKGDNIPWLTKLSWETNWHSRWEVLTALVRTTEQEVRAQGLTSIPATVTTPIGLPVVARSLADVVESSNTPVCRRFFFTAPDESGGSDDSESDDDEEDDYGEIVLNPRFGMQRTLTEERRLRRPFMRPQLLPIDTRSEIKE